MMRILRDKRISIIWAVLRVWLGYNWVTAGYEKLTSPVWVGNKAGVAIQGFFKGVIAKSTGEYPVVESWYANFIKNVAMPNYKIFTYLIPVAETLVGIALILGTFTTIALIAGAFMNLNYMLAGAGSSNPVMYTLEIILLVIGGSVFYIGLDQFLILPIIKKITGDRYLKTPISIIFRQS